SVLATSSSVRSGTSARKSSTPSYTHRNAPAVNRLLPPDSSSGARSSTRTETPCSAAACAAQNAAVPAPTITTSAERGSLAGEGVFTEESLTSKRAGVYVPTSTCQRATPEGRRILSHCQMLQETSCTSCSNRDLRHSL